LDFYCAAAGSSRPGGGQGCVLQRPLRDRERRKGDITSGVKSLTTPQILTPMARSSSPTGSGERRQHPDAVDPQWPPADDTYVSIDNANVDTTPVLQVGNSFVLRESRLPGHGFFAGTRRVPRGHVPGQPATEPSYPAASHNAPRFVGMVSVNLWTRRPGTSRRPLLRGQEGRRRDGERRYQIFRKNAPGLPLPPGRARTSLRAPTERVLRHQRRHLPQLSAERHAESHGRRRDRWPVAVRLLRRRLPQNNTTPSRSQTRDIPNVLKQTDYLAEAGTTITARSSPSSASSRAQDQRRYLAAFKASSNQTWIAFGAKSMSGRSTS